MVSGYQINSGIRNRLKQVRHLFELAQKRLTVKQIPCNQQQILTLIRLERTDALHLALAKGAK